MPSPSNDYAADTSDSSPPHPSPPTLNRGLSSRAGRIELEDVLEGALNELKVKEADELKQQYMAKLAELYIYNADQLQEALADKEVLPDVRGVLRGLLMPSVRRELKRFRHEEMELQKAAWKPPPKLIRKIEVVRLEMKQLSGIDQVSQTFHAVMLIVLKMPGGALDEHLVKDFDGFPYDDNGKPTFRPSAQWYLTQIAFPNGREVEELESKVTKEGNDLHLMKRIRGEFQEKFELQKFPFDVQDLTITLTVNCATQGPVPVEISCPEDAGLGVDVYNFAFMDVWDLFPNLTTERATVGATKRRFPALHIRACVARKSEFVLANVAGPIAAISLLAAVTFVVPYEEMSSILEINVTVLLTVIAFKYVTASYIPQISYFTMMDIHVLANTVIIYLATICNTTVGIMIQLKCSDDAIGITYTSSVAVVLIAWVVVQAWFFRAATRSRFAQTEQGITRQSVQLEGLKARLGQFKSSPDLNQQPSTVLPKPAERTGLRGRFANASFFRAGTPRELLESRTYRPGESASGTPRATEASGASAAPGGTEAASASTSAAPGRV